jgi:endonuclease/exonuclease/phosphatase family metal-dependent hydrolase
MKKVKFLLRTIFVLLILAILFVGGILIYGTITEYKPEPGLIEEVALTGTPSETFPDSTIRIFNWNLGFGGLGEEMDFFYDGGKQVRAPRHIWDKDFSGMLSVMRKQNDIDFFLIQEIDLHSKRSYYVNMYDSLRNSLPGYASAFGTNYQVQHVPLPFTRPLGMIHSGLATYTRYPAVQIQRHQYPGAFPWPTRIFFLDRCFLTMRINMQDGKELLLINTHNSAYDETGELKAAEMEALKHYANREYEKGNYVIIGGDLNQCPPDFDPHTFETGTYTGFIPPAMSESYIQEGWTCSYDPKVPTNRHLDTPLDSLSFKTLIDFFIISPNLEQISVETLDLGFTYTDHNPILLELSIKP